MTLPLQPQIQNPASNAADDLVSENLRKAGFKSQQEREDFFAELSQKIGRDKELIQAEKEEAQYRAQQEEKAKRPVTFDPTDFAEPKIPGTPDHQDKNPEFKRTKRYDWKMAAHYLANGHTVQAVANYLGCTRRTVYAALRRSPGLRQWIEQEKTLRQAEAGARLEGTRTEVARRLIEHAYSGNIPVLLYLARQLNLGQSHYDSLGKEDSLSPSCNKVKK